MSIYLLTIGIILLLPILNIFIKASQRKSLPNVEMANKLSNQTAYTKYFYIGFVSVLLICIAGLRNVNIGIDTLTYFNNFSSFQHASFEKLFETDLVEKGYVLIQIVFNKLNLNFQIFLMFVSTLYIGVLSYLIYHYSKSAWFSYFIFIAFGYFTFGMTGMRQTVAIAFVLIAFIFAQKKKLLVFLFLVGIAATMHVTAIVFLPVYFILQLKLSRKTITLFVLFGALVFIFKNELQTFLNNYARLEYSVIETGGDLFYIFLLGTVLVGLFFGKIMSEENEKDRPVFYMVILACIILPITQFNPTVIRLNFYFSIFIVLYIPNMLRAIQDRVIRFVGYSAYLGICVYFIVTQVFTETSRLIPYSFFWQ